MASALYDCLHFCCRNPTDCDSVCRNKPEEFANRVREIRGFDLDNVPRAMPAIPPELPSGVPVIFHNNKRTAGFAGPGTVCLPLYKMVEAKSGQVKYSNPCELTEIFGLHPGTQVIPDRYIHRPGAGEMVASRCGPYRNHPRAEEA